MSYDREVLLKDCVRVSEAARCAGLRLEGKLREILHELQGSYMMRHGYIHAADDKKFLREGHPGLSEGMLSEFDAAFMDAMKAGSGKLLGDPSPLTRLSEAAEALREALDGEARVLPQPPTPAPPQLPTLVLGGPAAGPIIRGNAKPPLRPRQFEVIKTLWDAPEHRLTGEFLRAKSNCGDAEKILKRIKTLDRDWDSIIHLPGRGGRGYRIGDPQTTPE